MKQFILILIIFLILASILPLPTWKNVHAQETDTLLDDYNYYQKYKQYLDYDKKQKYLGYRKYRVYKKFRFKNESTRASYQSKHDQYLLYLSNNTSYANYKGLKKYYTRYENYLKKYLPYAKYASYKKYKRYNKKKYDAGKSYGTQEYKDGYDRYLAAQGGQALSLGEADLGGGALGPEITIGLENYTRTYLKNNAFEIRAKSATTGNPLDYVAKDEDGNILLTAEGSSATKIKYTTNHVFSVYNSVPSPIETADEISFEPANGSDASDIVFHFNRPSSSNFRDFRGKLKISYFDDPDPDNSDSIWAINTLPLEHYVWGMGEMAGTGPSNHSKVMTTVFRTYGYWKMKFSTKYALQGFKVNATPGNQLYYGYSWEKDHPGIRSAAEATVGKLVMYMNNSNLNEVTLTPYSSWSDGRTRSFQERWGSTAYPWCKSVKDPYGKNSSLSTAQLEASGNHMVGLIAQGSLKLAGDTYKWSWDKILKYYFSGINMPRVY